MASKWKNNEKHVRNFFYENHHLLKNKTLNYNGEFVKKITEYMNNLPDFTNNKTDKLGAFLNIIKEKRLNFLNLENINLIKNKIEKNGDFEIKFSETLTDIKNKYKNNEEKKIFNPNIYLQNANNTYNFFDKEENLFLDNSGTGSGKSFNNINEFINYLIRNPYTYGKNTIMVTPQKNMFDLPSLVSKLEENGLIAAQIRSQDDFLPESKNYNSTDENRLNTFNFFMDVSSNFNNFKSHETKKFIERLKNKNKEYIKIIKKKKENRADFDEEDFFYTHIEKERVFLYFQSIIKEIYEKYNEALIRDNKEEIDEIKKSILSTINNATTFLMQAIFCKAENNNIVEDLEMINHILNAKEGVEKDIKDFLIFTTPLTISLYRPCVFFCTSDKAVVKNTVFIPNKNGLREFSGDLFTMLSGTKKKVKSICIDLLYQNEIEDSKLYNEFMKSFVQDKNNPFIEKDIKFQLFIDEEHISYLKFMSKCHSNLVDDKINLLDSFIVMLRQVMAFQNDPTIKKEDCIDFKNIKRNRPDTKNNMYNRFLNIITYNFTIYCKKYVPDINTTEDFKYLHHNMVTEGYMGIVASQNKMNEISHIFENVIYMNSNNVINMEVLKNVFLEIGSYKKFFKIATNRENEKKYIDMYTLLNMVMGIFVSCSRIPDARNFLNIMNKKENKTFKEHQDNSLLTILNCALNNKDYLENIMDYSFKKDDVMVANILFTFFSEKLLFKLTPQKNKKNIETVNINNEVFVPLDMRIQILKSPPEIDILRVLYRDGNKVVLASATRGFYDIYNGSFDINFMKTVSNIINKYENREIVKVKNVCDHNMKILTNERMRYKLDEQNTVNINQIRIDFENNDVKKIKTNILFNKVSNIELWENGVFSSNGIETIKEDNEFSFEAKDNLFKIYEKLKLIENSGYIRNREKDIVLKVLLKSINDNKNVLCMCLSNCLHSKFTEKLNQQSKGLNNPNYMMFFHENKWNFSVDSEIVKQYQSDIENLNVKNRGKIILIFPEKNNYDKVVKFILYDSKLGNDPGLKDCMNTEKGTKLFMVTSYKSAGVGLNLVIQSNEDIELDRHQNFTHIEKDFSDIYFVTFPHRNSMEYRQNENNENNIIPFLFTLFKKIYHDGENRQNFYDLSYFDKGVFSNENKKTLRREYLYENIKDIMQSSGRIERRNNREERNIYFLKEKKWNLFERYVETFYEFIRDFKYNIEYNEKLIMGFSVNACALFKVANKIINDAKLSFDDKQILNEDYHKKLTIINNFFEKNNDEISVYQKNLIDFRAGKNNFFDIFNNHMRTIIYPDNIENIIKNIEIDCEKRNVAQKDVQKMKNIFKNMFMKVDEKYQTRHITMNKNSLSDIEDSGIKLRDIDLYGYHSDYYMLTDKKNKYSNVIEKCLKYIKEHNNKIKENTISYIPIGQMINNIKGNMAEKLFKLIHDELINDDIKPLNEISSSKEYCLSYELFDFALVNSKKKKIIFIDVKNMSLNSDNYIKKIYENAPTKVSKLKYIYQEYDIQYVYINLNSVPNISNNIEDILCRSSTEHLNQIKYFNMFDIENDYSSKDNFDKLINLSKDFINLYKTFLCGEVKNETPNNILNEIMTTEYGE